MFFKVPSNISLPVIIRFACVCDVKLVGACISSGLGDVVATLNGVLRSCYVVLY